MFRAQDLAMPIHPGSSPQLYCGYFYHTCLYGYFSGCGWNYHTYCGWNYYTGCGWNHYTGCGWYYYSCQYYTYRTILQEQQVCPPVSAIPGPVGPSDPVEGLQALKKQLELALASVEAQERVLHEHRGREGGPGGGGAAQGRTPERKG